MAASKTNEVRYLTKMQAAQYLGEGFTEKQIVRAAKKHPAFKAEGAIKTGHFEGTNIPATWYSTTALDAWKNAPAAERTSRQPSGNGKQFKIRLTEADLVAMRAGTLTAARQAELAEALVASGKYDPEKSKQRRADRKAAKKLGLTLDEYRQRKADGTLPAEPVAAPASTAEAAEGDEAADLDEELEDEDGDLDEDDEDDE